MPGALINVPKEVRRGEPFEIKTLVRHPMETGYRRGVSGEEIPRDIISRFTCAYNGEEIFSADLFPAIAANPFISFFMVAAESGELTFTWTDEAGKAQAETVKIAVA